MSTSPPPLTGLKVVELAGLAPAPFCGLLLAQYGASVLRIDRPGTSVSSDSLTSYKKSLCLDLKSAHSRTLLLSLLAKADVLIDPFRPGVLEKLGLDPEHVLRKRNPGLIVVRITGFRRDGKYKDMAGHDINYLAVSGVLSLLGKHGHPPEPPGNILADFAGGGLVAFCGVLMALLARSRTGHGQVVNANMADGVSMLATFPRLLLGSPMWNDKRGRNALDGGAPYYGCYETKDHGWMSVGALEPKFYEELLKGLGLREEDVVPKKGMSRLDKRAWSFQRAVFQRIFKSRTRKEWEGVFDGTDACVAPVLEFKDLKERDYDFRPLVELVNTPGKEVVDKYGEKILKPGDGGSDVLRDWMGWSEGKEYSLKEDGAAELNEKAKL